jgi:hypothetical protein
MSTSWPTLEIPRWRETRETLHRYAQIVGKIQLATTPRVSHFWNVALRPTARGLATAALTQGERTFDIELDFVDHRVVMRTCEGDRGELALRDCSVAQFDAELMDALAALGIRVPIRHEPVEIANEAIPFHEDCVHRVYDPEWASRFWRALLATERVLGEFRARFVGKTSPVGFYWGTFDLCEARYSGARASHPPSGAIEREAFSHEVSEAGFWPGDARYDEPAFFALHSPAPAGYAEARVEPSGAFWSAEMSCFVLPYEAVRTSSSPEAALLEFFETTYAAGATLARWNREELERHAA